MLGDREQIKWYFPSLSFQLCTECLWRHQIYPLPQCWSSRCWRATWCGCWEVNPCEEQKVFLPLIHLSMTFSQWTVHSIILASLPIRGDLGALERILYPKVLQKLSGSLWWNSFYSSWIGVYFGMRWGLNADACSERLGMLHLHVEGKPSGVTPMWLTQPSPWGVLVKSTRLR